jgi:UDP-N-acetyl-D-mannosaminuronic acid dehydrogenase
MLAEGLDQEPMMKKDIKHICVLGLGYIGLPTSALFAGKGHLVTGVDVNPRVVNTINQGQIHIEEPGLQALVETAVQSGRLVARTEAVEADVFIIAVPTPITADKSADLSFVKAAARMIKPLLRPGNLVILESTSPPGTTRDLLAPILSQAGLVLGQNLFLTHCPERVLPGRIIQELVENHRVIGGMTPACASKARDLYGSVVKGEMHLTDATTAEMVKVMENTYRDVNIALANELAVISQGIGINAWEVIGLANLHPRVNLHSPGPGVGGHCISVDPWFIIEQAPEEAQLIRAAREINDGMPAFVVEQVCAKLKGGKVAVLGVAYKGNIDDTRESPALEIIHLLREKNFEVAIYDPHVQELEYELSGLEGAFQDADCVLLLTPHDEYKYMSPHQLGHLVQRRLLIDTRNFLDARMWRDADFEVTVLGDGAPVFIDAVHHVA